VEVTKSYKGLVYGLRDDSAIVVDGDKRYVIGSEPVIIKDGVLQEAKQ